MNDSADNDQPRENPYRSPLRSVEQPGFAPAPASWKTALVSAVLAANSALLFFVVVSPGDPRSALLTWARLWSWWGLPFTSGGACFFYVLTIQPGEHRRRRVEAFHVLAICHFTVWGWYLLWTAAGAGNG